MCVCWCSSIIYWYCSEMSLARMAIQLCTAPGKVLVTLCWRYIAAGRHREFQWRMFTVGQSLWSAFERVGGVLCDVWQESNTATKWVKITVGMGVSQWRYGTVGLFAGVNPLRHTHTHTQNRSHFPEKWHKSKCRQASPEIRGLRSTGIWRCVTRRFDETFFLWGFRLPPAV